MNLNPFSWLGRKANDMRNSVLAHSYDQLGIWQGALNGFVPRQVNPHFYAALREAVGPLDGGLDRLVTMDGIIGVEGDNDALTQLIERHFLDEIPVNDLEGGFQAFFSTQGDAMLEQGMSVGEMIMDRRGKELIALRTADSKGIVFRREGTQLETWYRPPRYRAGGLRNGTDAIETVIRNNGIGDGALTSAYLAGKGYVRLDPLVTIYAGYNVHADNPYGVSIMRSIEFVSQLLVRIQNATGLSWDRFGDPIFHVLYKGKSRALKNEDFQKRRDVLATDFQKVLNAKRSGNSADFVQAVGADDDVEIKVIGADNEALAMEVPARHMLDQILSKLGLPSWMLGIEVRVSGNMGEQQSEMVIQASKTRFARRRPGLENVVATWLRGRGKTWKEGDWRLVQKLPNLYDELKRSQAGFLQAQTQMMLSGQTGQPQGNLGGNDGGMGNVSGQRAASLRLPMGSGWSMHFDAREPHVSGKATGGDPDDDEDGDAEPWADDDPELPKIESAAINALQADWLELYRRTYRTLKLGEHGVAWHFDASTMLEAMAKDQEWFIARAGAKDGPYLQQVFASWTRGLVNGTAELEAEALSETVIEGVLSQLAQAIEHRQLSQVRNTTIRTYADDIIAVLKEGIYNGKNPTTVARELKKRFKLHDYDWLRLARSEIASANAKGKIQSYIRNGFVGYDFVTAPGACEICEGLAERGPYLVGAGPMPMDDSHPNCRCTVHMHPFTQPPSAA